MTIENHIFWGVPVRQRDVTLYLASVKASDLSRLCEGLRSPDSRERPIDDESLDTTSDIKQFVEAVRLSGFAVEVSEIVEDSYPEDNPYQRIIDETRVKSIAAYLKEDTSLMPNSVVLALGEEAEFDVEMHGNVAELRIQWEDGLPLRIIDGQHRVEGLKLLLRDGLKDFRDFELPVCILLDLPFYMQAEIFAIINGKQTKVPRSRIYDLLGYRPMKNSALREQAYRGEMAVHRFCHQAVRVLNASKKSPWADRIKMRGAGKGVVTQGAMVDHLARLVLPKKNTKRLSTFPVLFQYFREADLTGISKLLVIYFLGIQAAWPEFWKDDSIKRSLFGKTNGIAVMFMILHDLILVSDGPEHLKFEFVREFWKKAQRDRISSPPPGGSKGYQDEWYRAIMEAAAGKDYRLQKEKNLAKMKERLCNSGALF